MGWDSDNNVFGKLVHALYRGRNESLVNLLYMEDPGNLRNLLVIQ
jgi:hypothetical protein